MEEYTLDYIKNETLATQIIKNEKLENNCELNDINTSISIERM